MADIKNLTDPIGALVTGINLADELSPEAFAEIEDAFNQRSVLVFRKQTLSEEQHVSFSRRFGDLETHVLKQYLHAKYPEILLISNIVQEGRGIGIADAGQYWHTDLSYVEKPSRCSLLYSLQVPKPEGDRTFGDTCFVSTAAAYDALDSQTQKEIENLQARHSYSLRYDAVRTGGESKRAPLTEEQKSQVKEVIHPVVRTHPKTGRKCIYVNEGFTSAIVGLSADESKALLRKLFDHCQSEQFMYRHKWQEGDLLMWDNCAVQHLAIPDYTAEQHRLMHRTTVKGDTVF
jgi:taurine dioxygenase